MIDFKKEEEIYQQVLLIKSVLKDFRAYDVVRQGQIDLMWHFNIFSEVSSNLILTKGNKIIVNIDSLIIGYYKQYSEIAHILTSIYDGATVKAEFERKYIFRGVTFEINNWLIATIPEEELILLELLGKVETTIIKAQPSTIVKSVFCPTQA